MLALTMGDPAGIGGELTLKAWSALRSSGLAFAVIDDPDRLHALDPAIPIRVIGRIEEAQFATGLPVLPISLAAPLDSWPPRPGQCRRGPRQYRDRGAPGASRPGRGRGDEPDQ